MEQATSSNSSLIPSAAMDLLLVVPRLAQRAGSFALFHMPEAMDSIAGKIFSGGSMIADATGQQTANSTITNTSKAFAQSTAGVLDASLREAFREAGDEAASSSVFGMMLQGLARLKNFGGIFSYLTSRWALATFTAVSISSLLGLCCTADLTSRLPRLSFSIVPNSTLRHGSTYDYDGICGLRYT